MTPLSSIDIKLCQAQAKIFESSVYKTKYSSPIFIRRFMYSSIAKSMDDKLYLYTFDTIDETYKILDNEFGEINYGKIKYSHDQMFWIGYVYRCISIIYNLSSKSIYKLFKAKEIINYYNICHTFDIVEAAKRMMESISYDDSSNNEKAYKIMKRLMHLEKLTKYLGKNINIIIDKPIGYNNNETTYTQNYGYTKEIKSLDDKYQEVYVIGIDKPLKTFKGKVIAIINRISDSTYKLVVCEQDKFFSKDKIIRLVNFQEKNFKSKLIV